MRGTKGLAGLRDAHPQMRSENPWINAVRFGTGLAKRGMARVRPHALKIGKAVTLVML